MYIKTTTRKNKSGSVVIYYHLAHNVRNPVTKNSETKILHTFGRADQIEKEALVRLCRSIGRFCDITIIDNKEVVASAKEISEVNGSVLGELELLYSLPLGHVSVIEANWKRTGIEKILRDILKKSSQKMLYERALFAMAANRLCEPESKLGVWGRWLKKVYLPSCKDLLLGDMYRAMDVLYDHAEEVEQSVFFHTANLFNLDVDVIFYDTTTVSFSIDEEDEDMEEEEGGGIRKYGKNKGGVWAPQVVVALAVTRDGLPVKSWVFPGNTADAKTVKRVRADMRGWKLNRALFVADGGVNSEENKRELSRACGKYLLATRMGSSKEVKEEVLTRRGRYTVIRDNLHAKEVIVGDGERRRRYILCYNPREAERQRKHREKIIKKLEEEINSHKDRLATNQWAIDLLASLRYKRYLTITKGGLIRIDNEKARDASRYDGKWVIETNDDTLSFEDAACGYKGLMVIERCFRSLKKTQIKMDPVNHWTPKRIESHIRICVLSLLIQRIIERECGQSWWSIRDKLKGLQVTRCETKNFYFFHRNKVQKPFAEIYKKLGIALPAQVLGIEER
jgi:transposase